MTLVVINYTLFGLNVQILCGIRFENDVDKQFIARQMLFYLTE